MEKVTFLIVVYNIDSKVFKINSYPMPKDSLKSIIDEYNNDKDNFIDEKIGITDKKNDIITNIRWRLFKWIDDKDDRVKIYVDFVSVEKEENTVNSRIVVVTDIPEDVKVDSKSIFQGIADSVINQDKRLKEIKYSEFLELLNK